MFTLLSLILLYCETIPDFNKYGPETRLCKQVVNYHCSKVPDTVEGRAINPLCFRNTTANYSGCRGIVTPSEFTDCGFPTSTSASKLTGIDYSCTLVNSTMTIEGPVIQYADPAPWAYNIQRNVDVCKRMQCTENSSEDYSRIFAISEVVVVSIFIIELVLRIIASTRPKPFEDEEDAAKRRHLHGTWSKWLTRLCGCFCRCFGCHVCDCEEDDHETEYLAWFTQNNEENVPESSGCSGRQFVYRPRTVRKTC